MKHFIISTFISLVFSLNGFSQSNRQLAKFKTFSKDSTNLKGYYRTSLSKFDLKKGEKIASVGAGYGNQEVMMSIFNDDIDWTLQEIDSTVLNPQLFNDVLHYFENIIKRPIKAKFSFVMGYEKKTNLPEDTYDKILIINTYHEITERPSILADVRRALRKNGKVIILENMAKKKGQIHQGCRDLKLWESDFLQEMEGFNFKLLDKVIPKKGVSWSYYTFESI
jgi:ubiquinone/menaquinone biosynthesis C-methylase UbiE